MPYVGWKDPREVTGIRSFGAEEEYDSPFGTEMLLSLADSLVKDQKHRNTMMTPTTLLSTPRQVILERFLPMACDPEAMMSIHVGTVWDAAMKVQLDRMGYETHANLRAEMFGVRLVGEPDGLWRAGDEKPFNWPDIVDVKFTSSGSMRFIFESGRPKSDHIAQVNMYRHMAASAQHRNPAGYDCELRYYCMPQKEKTKSGWIKMPGCIKLAVPFWTVEQIAAHTPAWEPKDIEKGIKPPPTVADNAKVIAACFAAIESGATPEDVLKRLPCDCTSRFGGSGRTYCNVADSCAMQDHGTTYW